MKAFLLGLLPLSLLADEISLPTQPNQIEPPRMQEIITPPVAPEVTDGFGFVGTADFIYWKARQNGLPYAYAGITFTSGQASGSTVAGQTLPESTIPQADTSFEPGFKVGVGYEFGHDGWDLYANYTWLLPITQNASVAQNLTTNKDLSAFWFDNLTTNPVQNISSNWRLGFNAIDIELGRNFYVSRFLSTRPYFGIKGTYLKEHFKIMHTVLRPSSTLDSNYTNLLVDMRQWIFGAGLRGGLDTEWRVIRNCGIYGNFALSALYVDYLDKRIDTWSSPHLGHPATQTTNLRVNTDGVLPILELALGVVYNQWLDQENYLLDMRLGWEGQVWFNTNRFFDSTFVPSGDLVLQGMTARFGFFF